MMRKITLLLMAFAYMIQSGFGQQVLFEEAFDGAALPTTWVNLDEDGLATDEFFAGNSLFIPTEWTRVNFNGPGLGAYSIAEFDSASIPGTSDDWIISPQVALLSTPSVRMDINGLSSGLTIEVLVATTLAGATPVASDFTSVQSFNPIGDQVWTTENVDLAAYANQSVYIAVRNNTLDPTASNQVKIAGLKNFQVLQTNPADIRVDDITITNAFHSETNYLVTNRSYATFACEGPAATEVTISFTNIGVNAITAFDAYFVIDSLTSGGWTAMETATLGTAVASGASGTYTFTTTADLSGTDAFYNVWAWGNLAGDISNADDTTGLDFLFTPAHWDIATDGDFVDGFEQVNFGVGQLDFSGHSWNWTIIDNNNDGITAAISAGNAGDPFNGDFSLGNNWNSDGTTAADEYAFSSCIGLETGVGYKATVQAACGEDANGAYPERFRFVYNTTPTVAGNTGIASFDVPLATYNEFGATFTVPTTGDYYFGIHINSDADQFFINIDDLNITSFNSVPTAGMSVAGHDQLSGGVYQSLCNGEFTITNTSTGEIDDTEIDWGDGNSEPFTSSSLTHTYAAQGVYTVTVTSTNVLGNDVTTEQVEYASPPTPDATFSYVQNGTDDVSVEFTAGQDFGCYTYDWNYGDNTTHGTTTSVTHTYTAAGTYTVTLFIQDPASGDNDSKTQEVVIVIEDGTAINDIDFVNGINVFPNPVNDELNVNFELNSVQNVEIALHSIDGKVVNSSSINTASVNEKFNTSNLVAGIYILDITTEAGKYTKNVVVK